MNSAISDPPIKINTPLILPIGSSLQFSSLAFLAQVLRASLSLSLKEELRKMELREITEIGPDRINRTVIEIYDLLSRQGSEGERSAAMFRELADMPVIVKQLSKAAKQGKLLKLEKYCRKMIATKKKGMPRQERLI